MIHLYFGIGLLLVALIAAGLAVREHMRWRRAVAILGELGQDLPVAATAPNIWRLVCFLLLLVLALIAPAPPTVFYKATIGLALIVFLLAELFLAIPGTPGVLRTGTNFAIFFLLWLGFVVTTGPAFWSLLSLVALVPLAIGALYWWSLRERLGYLEITVGLYILNCALAAAFAATLAATTFLAIWSLLAMVGTMLLCGAEMLRGWSRFVRERNNQGLYEMLLLMGGWLLLSISVWGATLAQPW